MRIAIIGIIVFVFLALGSVLIMRYHEHKELQRALGIPNKWADSINQADNAKFPPVDSTDIVFVGTSLTDNFFDYNYFSDPSVKNRGIHSNRLFHILKRIGAICRKHPRAVVIEGGINDLYAGIDKYMVAATLKDILDSTLILTPNSKIIFLSMSPVSSRYGDTAKYNPLIRAVNEITKNWVDVCKNGAKGKYEHGYGLENVRYVDLYSRTTEEMFTDDVHINARAYMMWAQTITPFLYEDNSRNTAERTQ